MHRLLSNESENRRKLQLLSAIMIIIGYLILYAVFRLHLIQKSIISVGKRMKCWSSCSQAARNMMSTSLAIRLKICRIYS